MQKQIRWELLITATMPSGLKLPELILSRLLAFLSYTDVEKEGIITPLTSLECKYKKAAFYEDQLQIHASLTKLSPVRLEFSYKVTRGGDLIATGKTTHGMVTKDLKPINVKKEHPEIYRMFENALD